MTGPWIAIAAIAATTERIRLGVLVCRHRGSVAEVRARIDAGPPGAAPPRSIHGRASG